MRNYSIFASASVALFALLILGCAKAPDQELKAAKEAVGSALTAQADKYAAGDYKTVKESLDGAITEIDKKNYSKAKEMLISATTIANNAKMEAWKGKKEATFEADTAITHANTLLTEVKGLIEKAPKGKVGMKALKSEVTAAETSLGEARSAISRDDYIIARDKATACSATLVSVKNTIVAPKAKTPEKGKKK